MLYLKQRGYKCVEVYYVHWVSQLHCLCSVSEHHAVYINELLNLGTAKIMCWGE